MTISYELYTGLLEACRPSRRFWQPRRANVKLLQKTFGWDLQVHSSSPQMARRVETCGSALWYGFLFASLQRLRRNSRKESNKLFASVRLNLNFGNHAKLIFTSDSVTLKTSLTGQNLGLESQCGERGNLDGSVAFSSAVVYKWAKKLISIQAIISGVPACRISKWDG